MSAFDALCACDPFFAAAAGKLEPRLRSGRATFLFERADVLAAHQDEHPFIAQSHKLETFMLGLQLYGPDVLSPLGDHLMTAMAAPYEREEERFDAIARMIAEVPVYLAEATVTLGFCDPLMLEVAVEVTEAFPSLFSAIAEVARAKASPRTAAALAKAAELGGAACKDFRRALKGARLSEARHLLGPDRFAELLQAKALPFDAHEIEALGVERFRRTLERRDDAVRQLTGTRDFKGALRSFDAGEFRQLGDICAMARDFVGEHALAPVPSDERVDIIETPAFARPFIPFASLLTAKPLWPVQRSVYYVTRLGSVPFLTNAALHEAYPGHHLQTVVANTQGELVRNLPWSTAPLGVETTEGWAHYAEAMMHQAGFNTSMQDRVQVLHDSAWRALRMLIDVRLQTLRLTRDDAAQLLIDELGMDKYSAYVEVRSIALRPAYSLCFGLGKHMIRELRTKAERLWGRQYSPSHFHQLIMTHGSLPLQWANERIEKWQAPS